MRAVRIREPGGADVLELVEVPDPEPGPGEALVRVAAAGVNRADLIQRAGGYPAPPGAPAEIPGLEIAGEVVSYGPASDREAEAAARSAFPPGSRVMAIVGGGAYAELAAVPAEHLIAVPAGLGWHEAAGIPEVFLTAADALFRRGRLEPGERVLVHSAGGGVGTAALQLARAAGARGVAGTASGPKLERIRALGLPLDLGVDYTSEDFAAAVREWTDGEGVDVILDTVGARYWSSNVGSLAELGRLVVVGLLGGATVEVDLRRLMSRRASVVGTVLRSRSLAEKAGLTAEFAARFLPDFEGDPPGLVPVIDRAFPLAGAAEAHRYMESNRSFGKIVLDVGG